MIRTLGLMKYSTSFGDLVLSYVFNSGFYECEQLDKKAICILPWKTYLLLTKKLPLNKTDKTETAKRAETGKLQFCL